MRDISQDIIDRLASETYRPCFLLEINPAESSSLYYTTWDYEIALDGKLYYPRGIQFGNIKYGSSSVVDNVAVKIDDVDRAVYTTLGVGGNETPEATVTLCILDENFEILGSSTIFCGTISEWSYTPGSISVKISSIFVQWANVTTSTFSGSCRWRVFKGPECKYSGDSLECRRTYSECETFSNTENFGGFRWLQGLEVKIEPATRRYRLTTR